MGQPIFHTIVKLFGASVPLKCSFMPAKSLWVTRSTISAASWRAGITLALRFAPTQGMAEGPLIRRATRPLGRPLVRFGAHLRPALALANFYIQNLNSSWLIITERNPLPAH